MPAGRALPADVDGDTIPDAVERAMDEAGFETAHIAGNSLGGYVALQLAARGRARSVVALAPAGGWAKGDDSYKEIIALQSALHEQVKEVAPHAEALVATPEGRRRATRLQTTNFEHIPAELLAHQMLGVAGCTGAPALVEYATARGLAARRRADRLPGADRVGHRGQAPAVAVGRDPLPRGLAPARRLGRARRHRPLPAARRPARGGAAHPGFTAP